VNLARAACRLPIRGCRVGHAVALAVATVAVATVAGAGQGRAELRAPPAPATVAAIPSAGAASAPGDVEPRSGFAAWLAAFRSDQLRDGAPPAALDAVLNGLTYSPRVVELDRAQPDGGPAADFAAYRDRHVEPVLIARGRRMQAEIADQLGADELATGIPRSVVLAIWGMESSFGVVTGTFDVPRSLATLAFDGRRREMFTRELAATVSIVASGRVGRDRLTGSWAGAMGQPQFLPSTYLAYARDADGDGHPDIWTSRSDVALSIATKLAAAGWRRGGRWGLEVAVPPDLARDRIRDLVAPTTCPRVYAKHSRWLTIGEWRALGLTAREWPGDAMLATLVEPDGPGGPAYLTLGNYRALLGYNCSNFYALSVGILSDALR